MLTSDSSAEERKVVTILFADVVSSTLLSTRIDAEHLREQMARFFHVAREEIERYGGIVEKFIGDAVMAVFGLPVIHEDDPARAVQAALAIRGRTRPLVESGVIPEIRIGIHSGEVVANPRAASQGEFLITGEAVNLAARLQQHAQPGQILVGESTYSATHSVFKYRQVAPLQLKGRTARILAFACAGVARGGLPASVTAGLASPLIGRDSEFAALMDRVHRLSAGQGCIVAIIGEAGMGKSRLVAEVRRAAEGLGLDWLEGHALSYGQAFSYWPFLEIVRTAAGIVETDTDAESWRKLERRVAALLPDQVPDIVPYLGTLLGLPVPPRWEERIRYLDGDAMGRQIFRSSRLFFEHLAKKRPLLLVFEDLHWADNASVALMEHLFPLVQTVPLILCGLGRLHPGSAAARLRRIAKGEHADSYTEVILTPLSTAHVYQLARNLLRVDAPPPPLLQSLGKAEGNPLFVEEIVRALSDPRTVVREEGGRWPLQAPLHESALPETLRGVIMARVDGLNEHVKEVLKTAAVIGRTFSYRLLAAVTRAGPDLDGVLEELQALDFVDEKRPLPELEFAFRHGLMQEATYESILLRRRRELHRQVGDTIEALFADRLEEFYAVLAYHYAQAEEWQRAQGYLFKAGDQAHRLAADVEALAHYRQAVAAYGRAFGDRWDPVERAALERKMGEVLFRRGEHEQAREHLERALAQMGAPIPSSRWAVRVGIAGQLLRQLAYRVLSPAVMARTRQSTLAAEERCRIYEALGWMDYFTDSERLLLDALLILNIAERHHLPMWIATAEYGVGVICELMGLRRLAEFYSRRALALAERIRHTVALGLAHFGLGLHELHDGAWHSALDHFQVSASVFRQTGELRQQGIATTMTAWLLRARGEVTRSVELSQQLVRLGEEAADTQVLAWGLAELGRALAVAGAIDDAGRHLERAIALSATIPDYVWVVDAMSSVAMIHLRQGRFEEALATLADAERVAQKHGLRGYNLTLVRTARAEACIAMAERSAGNERMAWLKQAREACRALTEQATVDAEARPGVGRLRGALEWLRGRPSTALRWWERGVAEAQKLGAQYELGLILWEMGRQTGDPRYLERAEAIFVQVGARWDLARVRELSTKAG